jgi:hypothetical protein
LRTTWPIDTSPLEGTLQNAYGRDNRRLEVFKQLNTNATGSPLGVLASEAAGPAEKGLRIGGSGRTTSVVAKGQAISPAIAEGTPEGPNSDVGETKFGGDLGQSLASKVAFDDILSSSQR